MLPITKVFRIRCRCGKDDGPHLTLFNAINHALKRDWITKNGVYVCPKCQGLKPIPKARKISATPPQTPQTPQTPPAQTTP